MPRTMHENGSLSVGKKRATLFVAVTVVQPLRVPVPIQVTSAEQISLVC